jgi:hypothetical protein
MFNQLRKFHSVKIDREMIINSEQSRVWKNTIEASSIDWAQQSRFHLMTREKPSLETLWFQNITTMDKVLIIDRSNTVVAYLNIKSRYSLG